VAPPASSLPESYATTLQEIKTHLRNARVRAALAANPIVIEAYWQTGKIILTRQQDAAWGAKVIDRLAADLKEAFPDMGGLSRRNLFSMRNFAECFPDGPIVQQAVAQLPWGHVVAITQRLKIPAVRDFYIRETLTHGWNRNILEIQIQNRLHLRAGKAQNNFALTMPPADSDMAGLNSFVLTNLESLNSVLIRQGLHQPDRLATLNGIAISQMRTLLERGIRPESRPPAEDVKKAERRLTSAGKKSLGKPCVLKMDTKP